MGAVFRAFDRERNQRVALKRLLAPDASSIYRFKREFRALANVAHPNLVALYDLVSVDDDWYFTMELVHGIDLLSFVRGGEPMPTSPSKVSRTRELGPDDVGGQATMALPDAGAAAAATMASGSDDGSAAATMAAADVEASSSASIIRSGGPSRPDLGPPSGKLDLDRLEAVLPQLVEAIVALHRTGHLHRDIKPNNVMVTPEGRVVVLDFGVITELAGARRSGDDKIAGTPAYMAPELVDGDPPSEAADWYAVGIVLYRALTGLRPFVGSSETIFEAKRRFDVPLADLDDCQAPAHLISLCRDLLQRDPKRRPSGEEILERLGRSGSVDLPVVDEGSGHLVGREAELDRLRQAWDQVRAHGQGTGVFLFGSSGVGKSALVEAFLAELERSEVVVLSGRCFEQESVPYKAVDSLIDSLARYLLELEAHDVERVSPEDAVALVRAFPVLGRVEVLAAACEGREVGSGKDELQRRAFAALAELLGKLARQVPLALYIDDLQWGDVESAGFLARLVGPHGPPLLFLAGYRSEQRETSQLLPALFSAIAAQPGSRIDELEVAPLDAPVLESLALELLDSLDVGGANHRARARQIAAEAKGSPYFVHELVRYSVSGADDAMTAQASLASVIQARAACLSAEAQRLLRVVCVAGWRMSMGVAQSAAELGPEERRAFVELRAGHFVKSTGTRDSDTIEPYHDRVREMLVQALAPQDAQRVHRSIAEALETSSHGDSKEHIYALANHWYLAAAGDRQAHVLEVNLKAGRTAAESFAYHQALSYLTRAEEVARGAGLELGIEDQLLLADAEGRTGLPSAALERYDRVLVSCEDPMVRAEIRLGICRIRIGWLDAGPAIDNALAGLRELGMGIPKNALWSWLKAVGIFIGHVADLRRVRSAPSASGTELQTFKLANNLHMRLGLAYYFDMTPQKLVRSALYAMQWLGRLGASRETVEWFVLAGGAAAALQRESLVAKIVRAARDISSQIHDPVATARYRLYRGIFSVLVGDTLRGERELRQALDEVGSLMEPHDYYTGAAALSWTLLMRGRAREGWDIIEHTLKIEAAGGQLNAVRGHSYRSYAGPLLGMLGRIDEGRAHMAERGREEFDENTRFRHSQQLSHTMLFQVEADDLGAAFEENVRQFEALRLSTKRLPVTMRHCFIAIAYGLRRKIELAQGRERDELLRRLGRALKQVKATSKGMPLLFAHQALLEASYHNLNGKEDGARRLLAEAEEHARASENDWVLFEILVERARYALAHGDRANARKRFERAREFASEREWTVRAQRCAAAIAELLSAGQS